MRTVSAGPGPRQDPRSRSTSTYPVSSADKSNMTFFFFRNNTCTVLHVVDCCARYQEAIVLSGTMETVLLDAPCVLSVCRHGPPKKLITHGGDGIQQLETMRTWIPPRGINRLPRLAGAHARYADRRGSLLRDAVHKVTAQLKEWGMGDASVARILAEPVFASNVLLMVGGYSPYNAIYGPVTQTQVLPDISCLRAPDEGSFPWLGTLRDGHRLRQAAIACMVRESASKRHDATWRTHDTRDGHALELNPCDCVQYHYRDQCKRGGKKESSWREPAQVVEVSKMPRTAISLITPAGGYIRASEQNCRPHLHFFVGLASHSLLHPGIAMWRCAAQYAATKARSSPPLKFRQDNSSWPATASLLTTGGAHAKGMILHSNSGQHLFM